MQEVWRDSISMTGYQVSNFGNVRHANRKKSLAPQENGNGYVYVTKKKNGKRINYYVHRLIAEVFCDNAKPDLEVNHIDFNRSNNKASNLEWCTRKQNVRHSADAGRYAISKDRRVVLEASRQRACEANRKRVALFDRAGNIIKVFASKTEAGLALGVSITSISRAICGKAKFCEGVRLVLM